MRIFMVRIYNLELLQTEICTVHAFKVVKIFVIKFAHMRQHILKHQKFCIIYLHICRYIYITYIIA